MLKIAALPDEVCPKCGACNPDDRCVSVWRVSDGTTGLRFECDVCAHEFRLPPRPKSV